MLTSLLEYVKRRMDSLDSGSEIGYKLNTSELKKVFVLPLVRIFEDKIFSLSRSSYVQYLPLFIIAFGRSEDKLVAKRVSRQFTENVMSMLIFKAFCI